jgi:sporulation protein YlmC with PRC-barrel domain
MEMRFALLTILLLMGSTSVLAQQPEPAQPGAQPAEERDIDRDRDLLDDRDRDVLDRDRDVLDRDIDVAVADQPREEVLTRREAGQMRSDELVGSDVLDAAGDNVASVNELLIDRDGRVAAILIRVGGILGIGATTVALPWDSFEIHRIGEEGVFEDAFEVRTHMTREQLEDAPEFEDDADDWF